jgi:hypothetical protein
MSARCELSDLLIEECACRIHTPARPPSDYVITARFLARFDSKCDGCGNAMDEGDPIARTEDSDYICEACS